MDQLQPRAVHACYPRRERERPEVEAEMNRAFWAVLFDSKNPFRIWLPPSIRVRPLIFLIALRGAAAFAKLAALIPVRPSTDRRIALQKLAKYLDGWQAIVTLTGGQLQKAWIPTPHRVS